MIPAIRIDPSGAYAAATPIVEIDLVPEVKIDTGSGDPVHGLDTALNPWKAIYLQEGINKTQAVTVTGNNTGAYSIIAGYPSETPADKEVSIAYEYGIIFFCNGVDTLDDSFQIDYTPIGTVVDTHPALDTLRVGPLATCEAIGEHTESQGYVTKAYGEGSSARGSSASAAGRYSVAEGSAHTGWSPQACSIDAAGVVTIAGVDVTTEFSANDYVLVFAIDGTPLTEVARIDATEPSFAVDTTFTLTAALSYGAVTNAYIVDVYMGRYARAHGHGTTHAIGAYSNAGGKGTRSIGEASLVHGESSQALGEWSASLGYLNESVGQNSSTFGKSLRAYGTRSSCVGNGCSAAGSGSMSQGNSCRTGYAEQSCLAALVAGTTYAITIAGDVTAEFTSGDTVVFLHRSGIYVDEGGGGAIITVPAFGGANTTFNVTLAATLKNLTGVIVSVSKGTYAHAEGDGTNAIGQAAHSEGDGGTALGNASHVEGSNGSATGAYSHCEGDSGTASGTASHAEGFTCRSIGNYSHAEGDRSDAYGRASHAEGDSDAYGDYSHSEGHADSFGENAHAEGVATAYGDEAHGEGGGAAYHEKSHSEGSDTLAGGFASHAEGEGSQTCYSPDSCTVGAGPGFTVTIAGDATGRFNNGDTVLLFNITGGTAMLPHQDTIASAPVFGGANTTFDLTIGIGDNTNCSIVDLEYGSYAHSEGDATKALGTASHAEGHQTTASGDYSHSEGSGTTASGNNAHSEGQDTTASGVAAHAEGDGCNASGAIGHAEGEYTTASGLASHSEGSNTTTNSKPHAHAEGAYSKNNWQGSHASAEGIFGATGDAQYERIVIRVATADATPTKMRINATEEMILPASSLFRFTAEIVMVNTANGLGGAYRVTGLVGRVGAAAANLPTPATVTTEYEDVSLAACDITVSVSGNNLEIVATGIAATTIRWVGSVHFTEVVYA